MIASGIEPASTSSLADEHLGLPCRPACKRTGLSPDIIYAANFVSPALTCHLDQIPGGGHSRWPVLQMQHVYGWDIPPRGMGGFTLVKCKDKGLQVLRQLGNRLIVHIVVEYALYIFWGTDILVVAWE